MVSSCSTKLLQFRWHAVSLVILDQLVGLHPPHDVHGIQAASSLVSYGGSKVTYAAKNGVGDGLGMRLGKVSPLP